MCERKNCSNRVNAECSCLSGGMAADVPPKEKVGGNQSVSETEKPVVVCTAIIAATSSMMSITIRIWPTPISLRTAGDTETQHSAISSTDGRMMMSGTRR